jgi:SAM-dependent methyltransferase
MSPRDEQKPKHPARYSTVLLPHFAEALQGFPRVLDPFAGTGRIHLLRQYEAGIGDGEKFITIGVEIEPEWAHMHPNTYVGNALALQFDNESFDAICTSPTYGNRFADKHNAQDGSERRTYTHDLGRQLHAMNSGGMQWSDKYRAFHEAAWRESIRVLKPGGRFVLNIKDHIRKGERQHVAGWHVTTLCRLGLLLLKHDNVNTPGMRNGANNDKRVGEEIVYTFSKHESQ